MEGLDEFRKNVMNDLLGINQPAESVVSDKVSGSQSAINENSDLGDIISNIVENRVAAPEVEPEGMTEARKEAIGSVDWSIMNALFNK